MKAAMTDIAFNITQRVWSDLPAPSRGSCFFCIGGVNAINPFSATAVKNEIVVYSSIVPPDTSRIAAKEGSLYDMRGTEQPLDLTQYDEIYMDFNGSMAFLSPEWIQRLREQAVASKVVLSLSPSGFSWASPLSCRVLACHSITLLTRFRC